MRPWTEREVSLLKWYIGHKSLEQVARLLDRSVGAIKCKASRLGIAASRATYSQSEAIRKTGYNWKQLQQARKALGQRWKRINSKTGRYRISDEQLEDLVSYLSRPAPYRTLRGTHCDTWAPRLKVSQCLKCGVAGPDLQDRHYALGLCYGCWHEVSGHKNSHRLLVKQRAFLTYWKALTRMGIPTEEKPHPFDHPKFWSRWMQVTVTNFSKIRRGVYLLTLGSGASKR